MTTEEAKRRAELYSALAEGKTIQAQNPSGGEWFDVKIETLRSICEEINYRIKPEPKYRPFKTQEECWEEMHKHPDFGWIVAKDKKELVQIGRVLTSMLNNVMITLSIDEGHNFNSSHYFKKYTFTDGAPFGIKEE